MASADARSLAIGGVPLLYNAPQHGFILIETSSQEIRPAKEHYHYHYRVHAHAHAHAA